MAEYNYLAASTRKKCHPLTQTLKSSSCCINLLFRVKAERVGLSAFVL